ncbi:MAG: branched-chain amino acid ABC transporter permease [Chloroflexi bacterium]|nr:branched-chain amino acid ABC transporter permease [Chloroflexota bacterium]
MITALKRRRTQLITLAALIVFFLIAMRGMETQDWMITVLRGLAVAAVTFLVASGFSLIFGLMDVLNLAHGTLFMIGAYIGWTMYLRPDTVVDLATPAALLAAGLVLAPVFQTVLGRVNLARPILRVLPWAAVFFSVLLLFFSLPRFPITAWDAQAYEQSPVIFGVQLEQGTLTLPEPVQADATWLVASAAGLWLAGLLLALALAAFARRRRAARAKAQSPRRPVILAIILTIAALGVFAANGFLTQLFLDMGTTARFLVAMLVAPLAGAGLGALIEMSLIRPLYARPIYQLMLTLGLGVVGREVVIAIWGRTQLTMPKPALFNAIGKGCPAADIGNWLATGCSTISFMGSRIRTYNEMFVILVGVVVLIAVSLLLKRSRVGMVIRAGVQDREMVEALGTNVRRVFTFVFALGVGLAALGGVLAAPAFGLSDNMGESLLLSALIALAIGGLTSFPGAAAGSLLVGLLQQFIVQYGQIGIALPFLAQPFKPTPPLVPASTLLLMIIILLAMPQGLFGRKD